MGAFFRFVDRGGEKLGSVRVYDRDREEFDLDALASSPRSIFSNSAAASL